MPQPKPYPHNSSLAARRTRLADVAATAEYSKPFKRIEDLDEATQKMLLANPEDLPPLKTHGQYLAGEMHVPSGWIKGQLLNVRNNGAEYVVTLLGEEFDPRHPERALKFQNPARCQDFVSKWYAREHFDPRAF